MTISISIAVASDGASNASHIDLANDVHVVEIALLKRAESHDCVIFFG